MCNILYGLWYHRMRHRQSAWRSRLHACPCYLRSRHCDARPGRRRRYAVSYHSSIKLPICGSILRNSHPGHSIPCRPWWARGPACLLCFRDSSFFFFFDLGVLGLETISSTRPSLLIGWGLHSRPVVVHHLFLSLFSCPYSPALRGWHGTAGDGAWQPDSSSSLGAGMGMVWCLPMWFSAHHDTRESTRLQRGTPTTLEPDTVD